MCAFPQGDRGYKAISQLSLERASPKRVTVVASSRGVLSSKETTTTAQQAHIDLGLKFLVKTKRMLSALAKRAGTVARSTSLRSSPQAAAPLQAFRQASDDIRYGPGGMLENILTGPAKEEAMGTTYNRDPIYPEEGAGSKEMPFEVPSQHKERIVGFAHPESQALYWFPLKAGKLHYVEEIDSYFKLVPLPCP